MPQKEKGKIIYKMEVHKLKKMQFVLLVICLMIMVTACDNTEQSQTDPVTETENYLDIFNGYWKRPDDYVSEGISLVDQFEVYAYDETWRSYDSYGNFSEPLPCYANEDSLSLDLGFNVATFYLEDGNLTDGEGTIHFIPTDFEVDTEAVLSKDAIEGTWYRFGNIEESKIVLHYDDSYEHYYSSGNLAHSSTWTFSETSRGTLDRSFIDMPILTLVEMEGMFDGSYFILDDKLMLNSKNGIDSMFAEFYVHESAIDENSLYTDMGNLLITQWESGIPLDNSEDIYSLKFEDTLDKRFYTSTTRASESSEGYYIDFTQVGNWDMPEVGKLVITFTDGTVEEIIYDNTVIEVDYLGDVFAPNGDFPVSYLMSDDYYIGTWLNSYVDESIVFHDESTYTIISGDISIDGEYTTDGVNITFYQGDSIFEGYVDDDEDLYIEGDDTFNGGYYFKHGW